MFFACRPHENLKTKKKRQKKKKSLKEEQAVIQGEQRAGYVKSNWIIWLFYARLYSNFHVYMT